MISLRNYTPKGQSLEVWVGNCRGYEVKVYQKRVPLSFVPKWFYTIKKGSFVFNSISEIPFGYNCLKAATEAAYQQICAL